MRRPTDRPDRRLLIGVTAVVLLLGGACDGGEDAPTTGQSPVATGAPDDAAGATAEEVATGFVEAFGAFDVDEAISYLAEDADLSGIDQAEGTEHLRLLLSLLEAQGYTQMLNSCEELVSSASDTNLRCTFDFHGIRSDEIGLGPYSGSFFDLIVRDGEIVRASLYWETEEFSPQMWEPFAAWVSEEYPEDSAVMYQSGYTSWQLTRESIRLWEQRSREYAQEMSSSAAVD